MIGFGRVKIGEDKKLKYAPETLRSFQTVIENNVGKVCYITLELHEDVDYKKDLIKYYTDIIVPAIYEPLKSKGIKSIRQTHQFLLHKFSTPIEVDCNGLNIIPKPIEDMELQERVKYITAVGVWATTDFGIHLKSVNEL